MTKILVTSALPYANGPIHVGHLVEYIQTDIFVRFLKSIGKDAIYCCADDTHGTPIEVNAKKQGIEPEKFIEKIGKEHIRDFKNFLIKFDSYYSTNSKENKEFADHFFNILNKKGYIYKKKIKITYCENCKRALPDRFVKGKCPKCKAEDQYGDACEKCGTTYSASELIDPYCVECKKTPTLKDSEHYFFKLSEFSDKLTNWLDSNKELQEEIKNYIRNLIKEGLKDWDISRDGPYFGFKIPGEENKYYYVWLDAPIGYIASTANYCKKNNLDTLKDYWQNKDTEIYHFIGKDIIYFHFLFWPAMLIGVNFNLPKNIPVHGFLNVNGEKMSKSRGTFFTAKEFLEKGFDPEHLRFYFAKNLGKRMSDINLDFKDFQKTINNELVGNIGNFSYRVLSFLEKNFDAEVTEIADDIIKDEILAKSEQVKKYLNNIDIANAVKQIMEISAIGNKYFQDNEPWKNQDKKKSAKVLGLCVNIVRNLSILMQPITPLFSREIQSILGQKDLKFKDINFEYKGKVGQAVILMKKIEDDLIKEFITQEEPEKELFPLDLKIAEIKKAKDHPDAEKLTILEIDIGEEKPRQIVAGIRKHYKIDELIGKKIVVVANLKSAKLRGYESNGMLLAAGEEDFIELIIPTGEPGEKVYLESIENNKKQISFETFQKLEMGIKDKKILVKDKFLRTKQDFVKVEKSKQGAKVK